MIALLLKNWKLLLDILIVIAVVLAFTFWDPFHIFNNSKLKQTANMVSQIREVGQIITAEYYGEVLSSWKNLKLNTFPEDTITEIARDLYLEIKGNLRELPPKKAGDFRLDPERMKEYTLVYHELIAFLATKHLNKKLKNVYDGEKAKVERGIEEKVFKKLKNEFSTVEQRLKKKIKDPVERDDAVEAYADSIPGFITEFYDFYSMLKSPTRGDPNNKKNIVFIGRGWVKAGFDFGQLDDRNILYDKDRKTLHLFGLVPAVLNKDINPWFIPEQKVKGFELVSYSKQLSFEDAKAVKADCKQKLLLQAQQAGVIDHAMKNGEVVLKKFFSLLLDQPELQVVFHQMPYDRKLAMIAADTLVTADEALFIDSLYRSEVARIDTLSDPDEKAKAGDHLAIFINQLKKLPFIQRDVPFNYYMISAARMLRDSGRFSFRDTIEMIRIRDTLRFTTEHPFVTTGTTRNNPHWFRSGNFVTEFNAMLDLLRAQALDADGLQRAFDSVPKDAVRWDSIPSAGHTLYRYFNAVTLKRHAYDPLDYRYHPGIQTKLLSDDADLTEARKRLAAKSVQVCNARRRSVFERETKHYLLTVDSAQTRNSQTSWIRRLTRN